MDRPHDTAPGGTVTLPGSNSDVTSALADARSRYAARRPRSEALHVQARAVMPGGNTRTVLSYGPFPTAMARGEGCRLWDLDGHEYLDLCGEYTAGLFGHSEPRIHRAIAGAMAQGLNLAAVGMPEAALAQLLTRRFPAMELVRFTNSGTEANLLALTAARAFTGRGSVMAFHGGYHGGVLTFPPAAPPRHHPDAIRDGHLQRRIRGADPGAAARLRPGGHHRGTDAGQRRLHSRRPTSCPPCARSRPRPAPC